MSCVLKFECIKSGFPNAGLDTKTGTHSMQATLHYKYVVSRLYPALSAVYSDQIAVQQVIEA